jgi:hypothetical protein
MNDSVLFCLNHGKPKATGMKGRCGAITTGAVSKRIMSRKAVAERKAIQRLRCRKQQHSMYGQAEATKHKFDYKRNSWLIAC